MSRKQMSFTYDAYEQLIDSLLNNGYKSVSYSKNGQYSKEVILRHDVDIDLNKAASFAEFENVICDISATYFILLRTGFYNIFSKQGLKAIEKIVLNGHEVGLHFDESYYDLNQITIQEAVYKEAQLFKEATGLQINTVSMHIPSSQTLTSNYSFDNIINSYSKSYFEEWKYVSDSSMHWREDVNNIITSGDYQKLHILTHPFWYSHTEGGIRERFLQYLDRVKKYNYDLLKDSFYYFENYIRTGDLSE